MKKHSKAHRSHKAEGGASSGKWEKGSRPTEVYEGKDSEVEKEADERGSVAEAMKKGGRAHRKTGGKVMEFGKVEGTKSHGRADRKPRKAGGMCSTDWMASQGKGARRTASTEEP